MKHGIVHTHDKADKLANELFQSSVFNRFPSTFLTDCLTTTNINILSLYTHMIHNKNQCVTRISQLQKLNN